MTITQERQMVLQAVLDGQLSADYVTNEELIFLHHSLADSAIEEAMYAIESRSDVMVFNLDWEYARPN
jgi:hypothetical protein